MDSPGFVYIVQGEGADKDWTAPVKIGHTQDVRKRVKGLQTGNPNTLRLLVCFPGTQADEAALHRRFASSRLRDEWFNYTEDLEEFVVNARTDLLLGNRPWPDDMPLWFAPGFQETLEPEGTCSCGECVEDCDDEVRP